MIDKGYTYALVGASANPEKYGYRILKDLTGAGYHVIPVNPHEEKILGLKAYPKIADVPENIDLVILVVPPPTGLKVLAEVKAAGVNKVWLQPGAEGPELVEYCKQNDIECVHDECIMVERRNQP